MEIGKRVKNALKKLYYWEKFPFLCMFFLYLLFHWMTFEWIHDDETNHHFRTLKYTWKEEINYLISSTNKWSSRVLVNSIGRVFSRLVDYTSIYIWMIVNSGFYVLIATSVRKLIEKVHGLKHRNISWIIVGTIMIFPFGLMNSAGWLCTSVTYLWPLAVGLWVIACYVEGKDSTKHKYKYFIYALALLYASNAEGVSVLMTILFLAIVVMEVAQKKIKKTSICYMILCIASVGWHSLSPGNGTRQIAEMTSYFPDYFMLSFIDKIELAFSRWLFNLIYDYNAIFTIFAIVMFVVTVKLCSDNFFRCVSAIPLIILVMFSIVAKWNIYDGISSMQSSLTKTGTITVSNYDRASSYLPVILGVVVCLAIITTFYAISRNVFEFILLTAMFIGGMGAWMVITFSPTIWASGSRAFSATYFMFLILSMWIMGIGLVRNRNDEKFFLKIVWIFALFTNLNSLLLN